jgi:hypothetical protein
MHAIHSEKDYNSLTGAIPTEFGLMTDLSNLYLCKLPDKSYRYYLQHRYTDLSNGVHYGYCLFRSLLKVTYKPHPYFCHLAAPCTLFIPKDNNDLSGTIPTEIALMTSLLQLELGKLLGQSCRYHYIPFPSCALRLLPVSSRAESYYLKASPCPSSRCSMHIIRSKRK